MGRRSRYLQGAVLLALLGSVQAKLDLNSTDNIVVYWGESMSQSICLRVLMCVLCLQVKILCKVTVVSSSSRWLTTVKVSVGATSTKDKTNRAIADDNIDV